MRQTALFMSLSTTFPEVLMDWCSLGLRMVSPRRCRAYPSSHSAAIRYRSRRPGAVWVAQKSENSPFRRCLIPLGAAGAGGFEHIDVHQFNWTPGIGDPTIGGWITVLLYFL